MKEKTPFEKVLADEWQIKALNILFDAAKATNYPADGESEFCKQVVTIRKSFKDRRI